jgi:hypothetical protein
MLSLTNRPSDGFAQIIGDFINAIDPKRRLQASQFYVRYRGVEDVRRRSGGAEDDAVDPGCVKTYWLA